MRTFVATLSGMSLLLLTACGGKLPGFRVDEKTDSFVQASSTTGNTVDLLFIVDNSGSMADEQAAMAASFEDFITKFSAKDLDFRIGIVATDNRENSTWWTNIYTNNGIDHDGPGSLLTKYPAYRWLSPSTPDLVAKFQANVQLGTVGSGYEMPLSTFTKAITTKAAAGQWNEGFVRSAAYFAAIIVTDEDEHVDVGDNNYVYDADQTEMNTRLSTLRTSMTDLKGSTDKFGVWAITAPSVAQCPTAFGIGEAVMLAAQQNGGSVGNICSAFSDTLLEIGDSILSAATRFKLLQPPDGSMEVVVNGEIVPQDTSRQNGWDYLAASQEVEFYGSYIPVAGASINVNYIPASPNE